MTEDQETIENKTVLPEEVWQRVVYWFLLDWRNLEELASVLRADQTRTGHPRAD